MRRIIFALAIFLAVGAILNWQAGQVKAICEGEGNFCQDETYCNPGATCTAQGCCLDPPEPPAPGTCECGTKADGTCKVCTGGGTCNADYIRNCAGSRTDQIAGSQCVRIRTACKDGNTIAVGSAQSVGSCCEEWEVDGELACRSLTVYNYTCCPVGTTSSCYQGDPTYSYVYKNVTEDMGAPALSSFNAQCSPGKPISMELYTTYKCDRTGAPKPDGTKTCYTYRAQCRYPGVTLCDCVPTCTAGAPTNLSIVQGAAATGADVSWNLGSGGCRRDYTWIRARVKWSRGVPPKTPARLRSRYLL